MLSFFNCSSRRVAPEIESKPRKHYLARLTKQELVKIILEGDEKDHELRYQIKTLISNAEHTHEIMRTLRENNEMLIRENKRLLQVQNQFETSIKLMQASIVSMQTETTFFMSKIHNPEERKIVEIFKTIKPITEEMRQCLTDSITLMPFTDPVFVSSGHTFERSSITTVVTSHISPQCPFSREHLVRFSGNNYVRPNIPLRQVTKLFFELDAVLNA